VLVDVSKDAPCLVTRPSARSPRSFFYDEAGSVAAANDTELGLAAYLFLQIETSGVSACAEALETAMVGVKCRADANERAVWGNHGVRSSARGRTTHYELPRIKYICHGWHLAHANARQPHYDARSPYGMQRPGRGFFRDNSIRRRPGVAEAVIRSRPSERIGRRGGALADVHPRRMSAILTQSLNGPY